MTRVITIANQKGGVGKTTSTVNIAGALAQGGARVVVVDLDPQGNASTAIGVDHREGVPGIYEVLIGDAAMADVEQSCPDIPLLSCIPATIDLAGAEIELVSQVAREYRLSRALEGYLAEANADREPIDYVLLDCPPSLGLLTLNGLVAAREVLLPIQCEYYALEGLSQLLRTIDMVKTHLNPQLEVSAILLTMYDGRTRLAAQVAEEVRMHFGARVLGTVIPRNVRVSEAPSYGQTVVTYDPSSPGALTYRQAAEELAAIRPQSYPQQ
ncbi:MAG: ParA family protein [Candidatus Nanopelagicales bacterium]